MEELVKEFGIALGVEGRPAGEQLVKHRAQRILVGRRPDLTAAAPRLLRGHVPKRAQHHAGLRQPAARVLKLGDAKVADLRKKSTEGRLRSIPLTLDIQLRSEGVRTEEDIGGLEV